ncbi:MAG: acyltransferase family protein [Rhizobacter sp.]
MEYRREIDGLRSLAVLPVLLFHAGTPGFDGGFVGVDIFFVISGFLITSIILAEKEAGRFTIGRFYERRARRILPALFVVMFACIPFAWLWLLPSDMRGFSQSVVAVLFFASNLLFWRSGGYFGNASELNPLLHTWSLAVEEQYYLFFPVFIMLAWRWGRRWMVWTLIVAFVLSLGLAHWGAYNKPNSAFYLLPTRGWELLIGVFIAFHLARGQQPRPSARPSIAQWGSLAGLLLIAVSVTALDKTTPFPSLYALLPTMGAGLIILYASPGTWVGRALGSKLLVGIGLVSYSAYLWHQPLLAFARHRSPTEPTLALMLGLIALSLVLAYLSWKYVEAPFRRKQIGKRPALAMAAGAAAVLLAFGIAGSRSEGFAHRFPELQPYLRDGEWPDAFSADAECLRKYKGDHYCRITQAAREPTDALIGDSHSNHFHPGLDAYLGARGRNLLHQGVGGCVPLLDVDIGKHPVHGYLRCHARTAALYEAILAAPSIRTVYLSFHHAAYLRADVDLFDVTGELPRDLDREVFLGRALQRTVARFEAAGKRVVVLYDMPNLAQGEPARCLMRSTREPGSSPCRQPGIFEMDFAGYDRVLAQVSAGTGLRVFRTHGFLADFPQSSRGDWLYRDNTHLSLKGSLFFADKYDF